MNRKYLFALAIFPITASGASFSHKRALGAKAEDTSNIITFDYSKTDNTGIVSGGDVLKTIKENPSEAEVAYADANYQVKYDLFYENEKKFNYGTVDGRTYIEAFELEGFTPDHVEYNNGESKDFDFHNKTRYQVITDIPEDATDVKVVYKHTFDIEPDAANEILNAGYNVGVSEKAKQEAYDAWLNKKQTYENYESDLAKYKQFEAAHDVWEAEKESYDNYLASKSLYDADLVTYNQYLSELASYETKVENYKTYLEKLDAYNANKEAIEKAKLEYEEKMLKVDFQLGVMDMFYLGREIFPGVEAGGTLYSYIYRNAVNTVLVHQEDLSNITSPIAVSKAGEATIALRNLLDEYKTIRDSKDKKEMYKFYIKNYTRIKSNTIQLAQCLEEFFSNNNVRTLMEQQGKTERYIYLIAELIYVAECISDLPVNCFDKVYGGGSRDYILDHNLVIEGKTVQQILGIQIPFIRTYTTRPLTSYPASVDEVYGKMPEPADFGLDSADAPQKPAAVAKPTEPVAVPMPSTEPVPATFGAPSTKPVRPEAPGATPEQRNPLYNNLYNAVDNGSLTKTTEYTTAQTLTVYESFDLSIEDEQNIALYVDIRATGNYAIHEVVFFNNGENPKYKHDPDVYENNDGLYQWLKEWEKDGNSYTIGDFFNGSATIEGIFGDAEELTTYEVEWTDESGINILGSGTTTDAYSIFRPVFYSDASTKNEVIPAKTATQSVRYDFAGLIYVDAGGTEHEVANVSDLPVANETNYKIVNNKLSIKVKFNEVQLLHVEFQDDLGNTLFDAGYVEENTRVNYGGVTPTKEETDSARYEFIGWKIKDGSSISSLPYVANASDGTEIIIQAKFKEIKKWSITFEYGDNQTKTDIYEDGKMPVILTGETLNKQFTDNKYFVFAGWDKQIANASEDVTYVAQYAEHNIIENATIISSSTSIKVQVDKDVEEINIAKFIELLNNGYETKDLTIAFSKGTIEITKANLNLLKATQVKTIKISTGSMADGRKTVEVILKDKNGYVMPSNILLSVSLKGVSEIDHVKVANAISSKKDGDVLKIETTPNKVLTYGVYYSISINELSKCTYKVNGQILNLNSTFEFLKGEEIQVETIANTGITITKVIVLNPDDTTVIQKNGTKASFTLTNDVKLYSDSEYTVYTINIIVDGQVVSKVTAAYGSKVPLDAPYKRPENGVTYTFEGWQGISGNINGIEVTGDMDLVAVFSENAEGEKESIEQARSYTKLAGQILLAVTVVGFTIGFVLIVVVKRKEKDE